jgi:PAS domain S-box-containing protein
MRRGLGRGDQKTVSKPQQTLEDLCDSRDAAWLWDVARARLVWANKPAIKAFDAASVFDLIDRPFDPEEPALRQLAELQKSLPRGESRELILEFPSMGTDGVFACHCSIHALADGRDGILAVKVETVAPSILAEAGLFEDLPVATCAVSEDGTFLFANEMARNTFDYRNIKRLGDLILPTGQAEILLQRLAQTKLLSAIATYQSPYGEREARITLRRPQAPGTTFALVVIEDVTERRKLEREMAGPTDRLAPAEQQAFEKLGRTLTQAAASSKPISTTLQPKTVKPPLVAVQPKIVPVRADPPRTAPQMQLPKPLQEAFERNPMAIAIVQGGKPVFANGKLLELLGHADFTSLAEDTSFWSSLLNAPSQNGRMGLPTADGSLTELRVNQRSVPWQNGKAEQFGFELLQASPPVAPIKKPDPEPAPAHDNVKKAARQHQAASSLPASNAQTSEAELRSILDISADGIVTLDAKGNIRDFSAGAEAIFGFRTAEVLNKPFARLLSQDSAATLKDYLAGLEGQGLASVFNDGREVTGIVKQGGSVPLFLNIGRLPAKPSGAAFCVVMRDITTWKRTEKELREAKENAEEASRHKSEFLARVSHELRTPLNAIMGFSEIMRMGQYGEIRNDKYRSYLNDIHASGSHLLAMINDLLDLSKIEAGKLELNFTSVNLGECFDHAAKLLQDQATRARVLMRRALPENLPRIVADQRAMRQVMLNLMSNAIKYTDPGGQVIVSASVAANGALTLRLKDTGIGMNAEELKQALQPFTRVESPGRERQGTGLGLPLTKALVEANRADFAISSEPGQGTLVEVIFPTTRVLAE